MDNQLFLSIIIPVYNMEHYIVPCLESIFANRDIDKNLFEVIVVNDGSTDMYIGWLKNIELYIRIFILNY